MFGGIAARHFSGKRPLGLEDTRRPRDDEAEKDLAADRSAVRIFLYIDKPSTLGATSNGDRSSGVLSLPSLGGFPSASSGPATQSLRRFTPSPFRNQKNLDSIGRNPGIPALESLNTETTNPPC